MKKFSIIFAAMVMVGCSSSNHQQTVDGSMTQTSLDWAGIYQGVLPCADCEGINTTLTLNQDGSFKLQEVYEKGKMRYIPEVTVGKIEWNKTQPVIYLQDGSEKRTFFVGEGYVTAYDMEGNPIHSQLNYTLKQTQVFDANQTNQTH
ncbi:NlpE-like protein [Orbus hercynius]|uniref:NlpE-like protein n=1 Tax=Orbus hercynius TaxID=593135 RepID=A0A495RIY2_9GAMM|nr:copper resistance protein NlpE [Orbus hercynius]RKS87457.1 NlpE-like protein [Orbus hercynius]